MAARGDRSLSLLFAALVIAAALGGLAGLLTRPVVGVRVIAKVPAFPAIWSVDRQVRTRDMASLIATFQDYGYGYPLAVALPRIPRLYVKSLPQDWKSVHKSDRRKRYFVTLLLPLILAANEETLATRRRIVLVSGQPVIAEGERQWLNELRARYRVKGGGLDRLLRRVDVVPPSIAIAQAGIETGWGTSRFVREGNALFAEWVWDSPTAMRPKRQRKELGDYGVRRFDSLYGSVKAFMLNLNRHKAYAPFRERRAAMRAGKEAWDPIALCAGLIDYSERKQAYVELLRATIRQGQLTSLDNMKLAERGGAG